MPIVDSIGQRDGTNSQRQTSKSNEQCAFHGVSFQMSYF